MEDEYRYLLKRLKKRRGGQKEEISRKKKITSSASGSENTARIRIFNFMDYFWKIVFYTTK
jgi:hypothetical protein